MRIYVSPRGRLLPLLALLYPLCALSCFDEVESSPPCFLNGQESSRSSAEVSVNLCCEVGATGDKACQEAFFESESISTTISSLARCVEPGYCALCEVGVNCACVGPRDCLSAQSCAVTDDVSICREQFGEGFTGQRCAYCAE